jgi:ribonuclease BN (tRNA processing enzyme)
VVAGPQGLLQCGTCGFLVNDSVLIDAGTIGSRLDLAEQKRIRHVLLSHLHFDHIKDLPMLADNLVGEEGPAVEVTSIPEVLKGLGAHIFNGEVYPDFFRLPSPDRPVFQSRSLWSGTQSSLDRLRVTPIPVNHLVPTVGFLIDDGTVSFAYSGDTYVTEEFWRVASQQRNLKALLVETSFPEQEIELARVSKHLTPRLLADELRKFDRPDVPVYVYHMKPRFRGQIIRELNALGRRNLTVLEEGQTITL